MYKHINLKLCDKYGLSNVEFFTNTDIKKELICQDNFIEVVVDVNDYGEITNEKISEGVTDLIIDITKSKLLKKYINKKYKKESKKEVENLYKIADIVFDKEKNNIRRAIYLKVYDYIKNNDFIDIDGFVKFRIKEFDRYIPQIVEIALDKYSIEKEQDELISILRYFINIQEEKLDLLKIYINKDGTVVFYDEDDNIIKQFKKQEVMDEILKNGMEYEDFLISSLLNICPQKIEITDNLRNNHSKQIIETIKAVFGYKVSCIYTN